MAYLFTSFFLPIQTPILNLAKSHGLPNWLSLWKELIVFTCLTFLSIYLYQELLILLKESIYENWQEKVLAIFKNFWPTILIFSLSVWSFFTSLILNDLPLKAIALGFRFELWWLWFFALNLNLFKFYYLPENFLKSLKLFIYLGFLPVFILTLASLLFGQVTVLQFFAYKNNGAIGVNVCDPIDFDFSKCRLSGGFASPNHLAGYLILVLPIFLFDSFNSVQILLQKSTTTRKIYKK